MADEYVLLPRGKTKVLQAEDKNYKRGLLVRLKKDGGYRVAYWYEEPDKPNVVEVLVDGESIKKDARVVEFKFHPQMGPDPFHPSFEAARAGLRWYVQPANSATGKSTGASAFWCEGIY